MSAPQKTVFGPGGLRRLAEGRSFERDATYADVGKVRNLRILDEIVAHDSRELARSAQAFVTWQECQAEVEEIREAGSGEVLDVSEIGVDPE